MERKKILVIYLSSLFPLTMMNKNRCFQMIKHLSIDHDVDVITPYRNEKELNESQEKLKMVCNNFYLVRSFFYNYNRLKKIAFNLAYKTSYFLFGCSKEYFSLANIIPHRKIQNIIKSNKYNIIITHYWLQAKIFKNLDDHIIKVIDTHDILYEKKAISLKHKYGDRIPFFKKRELKNYGELEKTFLNLADVIVPNSQLDYDYLKLCLTGEQKLILIQNGQDIQYYSKMKSDLSEKSILFYGSMGGEQNILAFNRFYKYIYPIIKEKIQDLKLYVVGANPPEHIKKLNNNNDVIVSGFVDDVRDIFSKSYLTILPLEIGAGFRGRIVEVMAAGIPVIGTHNALDSLEMIHEKQGYIFDNNSQMANYAIKLLENPQLRNTMSENCKMFVSKKYSIEATYGKLSKYFQQL